MNKAAISLTLAGVAFASCCAKDACEDLAGLVSPIAGTYNTRELSAGNVHPAICRPWGMNCWTPQTGDMDNRWIYAYGERKIRGIRQTHQPSPWIGDYGQFAIMPVVGRPVFTESERASWFSHKTEDAHPFSYRVYLADHDTTVEVAPTERAAIIRVTYPESDAVMFVVDAFDSGSHVAIDRTGRRVAGYSTKMSIRGNEKSFPPPVMTNWFVMVFDRPFAAAQVWSGTNLVAGAEEVTADHAGALLRFAPMKRGERVSVRVASSFVDLAQAERNLSELGDLGYDDVAAAGRAAWNAVLSRIRAHGGTDVQRRTFYTCLYRALLFPRRLYEIGADGRAIHRSPTAGDVRNGVYFCDTGFWDTFRSLFPLLNFLYPEMNAEMTKGLEACWDECGWLPEWSSPGPRHCMIGNNSASVVADAWLSGSAAKCDIHKLYKALLHGANAVHPHNPRVGREGFAEYNAKGYVPRDIGINESAARTLEYAYDDWCIARLGRALARPEEEVALYERRSGNWRNVFNPAVRLACGRNADGTFDASFNRFRWGGDFTEGNALHYTWSVFHDIEGLIGAMGGREAFNRQLDEIFTLPPVFDTGSYGMVIHEMREMQVVNFGQYAHGNQPIQHAAYLYDWSGEPWKTQYWVEEIRRRLYAPTPDGYCGDEDNGQTSAWYVWSVLGFYPVCPGSGEYALGAPMFPAVTLELPGGKTLEISAPGVSPECRYVRKMTLNGVEKGENFLRMAELRAGGRLSFEMSSEPDKTRGVSPAAAPYSASRGGVK